jgi:histidine triad (HIT) family protein
VSDKTIFAKIIDKEIPARLVHEDDRCVAFHDINPQAPVHVLIVPRKPIDRVENLAESDAPLVGHLMLVATQIAKKLGLSSGYRLVINNGVEAGQTVFHLHVHLLGGRGFSWPPG